VKSDLATIAAAIACLKKWGKAHHYGGAFDDLRLAERAEAALGRVRVYVKTSVSTTQPELLGGKE